MNSSQNDPTTVKVSIAK